MIIHCNTGSPSEYGNTPPVRYAILTSEMMMDMLAQCGDLHLATDLELIEAIPSNVRWNWVGWYHLSNTHRVIKHDLVEEHFFITTDGLTRVYFKVVYATEDYIFPIVSEAMVVKMAIPGAIITTHNYALSAIGSLDDYKKELDAILDSADFSTTQLLNFIKRYMRAINVAN